MKRLVHAELFKLRTTSMWWLFTLGVALATVIPLVINMVTAHALLEPFTSYVSTQMHGHGGPAPADFATHLRSEWLAGHSPATQAATLFISGQLIGVLLAGLFGIVIVTSEFYQQTATSTFLITPRRNRVLVSKLVTAVIVGAAAWFMSTLLSVIAGGLFMHTQGYGFELTSWSVDRAVLLNAAAFLIWAVFGVGFGALIRNQLAATVSATVLYLAGATAASTVFGLLNTYVIQRTWVLTAEVIVPAVASTVMVSPTKTFDQSPPAWVGALVLLGYGTLAGVIGTRVLRRRDVT